MYNNNFKFFSKKTISYKSYSRAFKMFKKFDTPHTFKFDSKFENFFFFWWVLTILRKLNIYSNKLLMFVLINMYLNGLNLNLTKLFKNKKNYKNYNYILLKVKSLKYFFTKNRFFNLQKLFWPVRNVVGEVCWTNSTLPLKKNIKGFFLRKTKIFYKGRYARNRQTCRVIVFWTIAFNLIWLYGLYFFFYQFSFNFGYLWWGLFLFYFSLIWSSFIKYSFYNPKNLFSEFINFFKWLFCFIKSILK